MAEFNFVESVMDKVLVGSIAAVLSMFVLHGYNVHAKAFEGAQVQLRSLSEIHNGAKKEIILSVNKVRSIVGRDLISEARASDKSDVLKSIDNIRSDAALLKIRMPISGGAASDMADKLFNLYYVPVFDGVRPNEKDFKTQEEKTATEEINFVNAFDSELVEILSDEFNRSYDRYYSLTAWWARPLPLALASLGFSLMVMVAYRIAGRL